MKITRVNIPKSDHTSGLENIELDRLENMVLLAGANGSGKTRLLRLIERYVRQKPNQTAKKNAADSVRTLIGQIESNRTALNEPSNHTYFETYRRNITHFESQIFDNNNILEWNLIETDQILDTPLNIVPVVPKNVKLRDDRTISPRDSNAYVNSLQKLGIASLSNGTLPYIRKIQTRAFNASHPRSNIPELEKKSALKEGKDLENIIEKFLRNKLERSVDGEPILFGKSIFESGLSNGQNILLQLCVQIHAQGASLNNLIITMDEPENHLHPAASIDMISTIREAAPDCQIWIATHSLPILSYFNEATLLFMENGSVSYSGSEPEQVLDTLIGGDERVQKIRDFTSLPSVYAMNRYAAECLVPPTAVPAKEKDSQTEQIQDMIQRLKDKKQTESLAILDFGAGKGRLLESMCHTSSTVASDLNYVAYDEFTDDADYCKDVIKGVYGNHDNRYFSSITDITASLGKAAFDMIVMCNVLHEIDPKYWIKMFGQDGEVTSLLADGGILLLVEDEEIPVGEKAHTKGFIVYDTTELRTLFAIDNSEQFIFSDQRNDGRLKAHVIDKDWLKRVTSETRKASLKDRKIRSVKEIMKLRGKSPSYKNGRKHSFWVQQLANAEMALSEL